MNDLGCFIQKSRLTKKKIMLMSKISNVKYVIWNYYSSDEIDYIMYWTMSILFRFSCFGIWRVILDFTMRQ